MSEEITIQVKGMGCSACVRKIETAVKAMPGVKDVRVDLEKAETTVQLDSSGSTAKQVRDKIRELGYQAELPGGQEKKGLFGKLRKT